MKIEVVSVKKRARTVKIQASPQWIERLLSGLVGYVAGRFVFGAELGGSYDKGSLSNLRSSQQLIADALNLHGRFFGVLSPDELSVIDVSFGTGEPLIKILLMRRKAGSSDTQRYILRISPMKQLSFYDTN